MNKERKIIGVDDALSLTSEQIVESHRTYGNSGLTSLLSLLGFDKKLVKADGNYVWDESGNRYVDFLAG